MALKASEAILELKRRMGDVNMPVPDEVDALAYLNAALRAAWGYGVEAESPRLARTEFIVVAAESESAEFSKPAASIRQVCDYAGNRLCRMSPAAAAIWKAQHDSVINSPAEIGGYCESLSGITVIKSDDYPAVTLCVVYFPEYTPIELSDVVPFPGYLMDAVISLAIRLCKEGAAPAVNSSAYMLDSPISAFVKYFEGRSADDYICEGVW